LAAGATTYASYQFSPVHAISTIEIVSQPQCVGATAALATVALTALSTAAAVG